MQSIWGKRSTIFEGAFRGIPKLPKQKFTFSPLFPRYFTTAPPLQNLATPGFERQVSRWLLGSAGLVGCMVVLGGYCRTTLSGLSMVEWSPQGRPLPGTENDWLIEFQKYQLTPEYRAVHFNITLEEFKKIYFIEWFHRMFGRGTGIAFGGGFLYFLARGALKPRLAVLSTGFLALGGAQGLIGWWMVKSGLIDEERARVSAYRLATHFGAALGLLSGLLLTGWRVGKGKGGDGRILANYLEKLKLGGRATALLVGTTLMSGAVVAGLDAGHAYNTWPKMLDRWIPKEVYMVRDDIYKIFENTAVVQFNHRMLAYTSVAATSALFLYARRVPQLPKPVKFAAHLLPATAFLQVILGISTLVHCVPPHMAVTHQAGGLATWTSLLYFLHCLSRYAPK